MRVNAYGTSKAAVKLLTKGIFSELQDTYVQVTTVFPGAVETNITSNSGVKVPGSATAEESSFQALPAARAAEIIINGIEKNKFHILVGKDVRFMHFSSRLTPIKLPLSRKVPMEYRPVKNTKRRYF